MKSLSEIAAELLRLVCENVAEEYKRDQLVSAIESHCKPPAEGETPETDTFVKPLYESPLDWNILADKVTDFARQLERQRNEARQQLVEEKQKRSDDTKRLDWLEKHYVVIANDLGEVITRNKIDAALRSEHNEKGKE